MKSIYESLRMLGSLSMDLFWFPLAIWTIAALIAFFVLRTTKQINPLYNYHLRVATLAAIPFGFLTSFTIHLIRQSNITTTPFDGALFIVQSPIELTVSSQAGPVTFSPDFFNPNFLIGSVTSVLFIIGFALIVRLFISYFNLRKLHKNLELTPLNKPENPKRNVHLAFHDHPLVPFTFGWINPVIVLPESIRNDSEKVRMAIQHELVHIERGDYLLQLFLSVIESIFWFHPLIHMGSREIETYREISCDQQVLNTSSISTKKYASMLYELLPLEKNLKGFSVSMAVKQSTLKQRIEIMKYHKLYKISLKRSIIFFFAMTLLITLPIACSDLQGQQILNNEQLQDERISVMAYSMSVNGEIILEKSSGGGSGSGTGSAFFGTRDYGIFVIALHKMPGFKQAGSISDDRITFSLNDLDVDIISNAPILQNNKEASIWVRQFPEYSLHGSSGFFSPSNTDFDKEFEQFKAFSGNSGTYDKVPDQKPELIGGLAELQKKITYPEEARKTGVEGRVVLQFIVDEQGSVLDPEVIRGIGAGCDEAALVAISQVKFKPGIKNGEPVKTQFSLPVIFRLDNSLASQLGEIEFEVLNKENKSLRIKLTNKEGNPLIGANVYSEEVKIGAATNEEGIAVITNITPGTYSFNLSMQGYSQKIFAVKIND